MPIGILYSIYQNVDAVNCLTTQRALKETNSVTIVKMREYLNRLETDRRSHYERKLSYIYLQSLQGQTNNHNNRME